MLQDMDNMESSCTCYVEVSMLNRLEQSKIGILTITPLGIAMLTIHHYMILGVCFLKIPGIF